MSSLDEPTYKTSFREDFRNMESIARAEARLWGCRNLSKMTQGQTDRMDVVLVSLCLSLLRTEVVTVDKIYQKVPCSNEPTFSSRT